MKIVIPLPTRLTVERRKKKIREVKYETEYETLSFTAKQESINGRQIVLSVKGEHNFTVVNELVKRGLIHLLLEPVQLDQLQIDALRDALDNSNDDSTVRFDTVLNVGTFQSPIQSMKQWRETHSKQSEKNGHVNINININSNNEEIKMENKTKETKIEEVKETMTTAQTTETAQVESVKEETVVTGEAEVSEAKDTVTEETTTTEEQVSAEVTQVETVAEPKLAFWKKAVIGTAAAGALYLVGRFVVDTFLNTDEEVI